MSISYFMIGKLYPVNHKKNAKSYTNSIYHKLIT